MTAEHRTLLEAVDVLAVRIECVKCKAAVVIAPAEWSDAPFQCPGCGTMWQLPQVGEQTSPLQQLGLGLKLLQSQTKSAAPVTLPYRVRLELKDQA